MGAEMEGLDRVVESEVLDALMDALLDIVVVEMLESREEGRGSGKVVVAGDCSLEDGPDTTTGDDTAVPPGLGLTGADLGAVGVLDLPATLPCPS